MKDESITATEVGAEISRYLREKNLTHSQFAAALGVSSGNVYFWLTGKRPIGPERAWQMHKMSDGHIRLEKVCPHMPWEEIRQSA